MKKVIIIGLIVVLLGQGCMSLDAVIHSRETRKRRPLHQLGGAKFIYGDMLLGHAVSYDGKENAVRNLYQGNFVAMGLLIVDGLIFYAIDELFYESPDEKSEQKVPVNQDTDK